MKKCKVTFIPISGSGALHLDFLPGPFGDATEANRGDGVGFFSNTGELQGVTFDDVGAKSDRQSLEFDRYKIDITLTNGKVTYVVTGGRGPLKSLPASKSKTAGAA